ncbi:hypothetical protein GW17_00049487 [Ensete ventricosum]|nr:hypothetical protein GW17_00049487 [Ensete ventricosum]
MLQRELVQLEAVSGWRATAVASSWQRRQAVGRRCRRRTTTASTMGAGGRRQQSTVKDGRGGQLLQQGRQRRGWEATGQRSPMRGMTEGRPMATSSGVRQGLRGRKAAPWGAANEHAARSDGRDWCEQREKEGRARQRAGRGEDSDDRREEAVGASTFGAIAAAEADDSSREARGWW